MNMKKLLNNLEIRIDLSPSIKNNVAINFIVNKIMNNFNTTKKFEVPINYAKSISECLEREKIKHKLNFKNDYVSEILIS